ncbi:coenzyme F420-0:L-glutamate ligase [Novosphingobium sp. CCH12-A3]|uniref:coenzyme F420-0:L-glutamate ligase n=1 Tax=Novosphingobium sp. CCH12-A3 TaxID=1768752 RepID=UPI0007847DAB|nr:coenzyme F420-0:L-glutamate ligase [Novosphingobium sp. CCH12-A3]
MSAIEIIPLSAIGEVRPGEDLIATLDQAVTLAGTQLGPRDVLVVTQKIVSKAEGRWIALGDVTPGPEALRLADVTRKDARLVELVLRESTDVVRAVPNVLITRHKLGLVMANAGIDRSNIGSGDAERALLLPTDPDASAARICEALGCPVVISDSFGRPWRMGVVAVGIGAAGLPAIDDRRGLLDRDGRKLEVTQIAVADLLASAAALAMGEGGEGIPAVIVRGYGVAGAARPAADLTRPLAEDLFQ